MPSRTRKGYAPMRVRSSLVPVANLGSQFGFILVIGGIILYAFGAAFGAPIAYARVILFAAAVVFALVTLPVEYNASNRAREMLQKAGLVSTAEYNGASCRLFPRQR